MTVAFAESRLDNFNKKNTYMAHAAFHLSEEFITEDLDYYFSGERDKNNQIRPDDNIFSTTPHSSHLSHLLEDGQVANFFYPTQPNLLDRIYIGISVPLFANNWGASFLLQLLKVLKPGGAIILPVYPEGQAQEKGYWSRSFLENIFLSRQRWTGFSNVRAENDGVMSLSVGRMWPDPMPSTIEWFYQQRTNLVLQEISESIDQNDIIEVYTSIVEKIWDNYSQSAIVERIILDYLGAKTPVVVHCISHDYGLLITDLLLSPYVNVTNGVTDLISSESKLTANNFECYFSPCAGNRHQIREFDQANLDAQQQSNVICVAGSLRGLDSANRHAFLNKVWSLVKPMGLLVVFEDLVVNQALNTAELDNELARFGVLEKYSAIVASKIQEAIDISHYSTIQEAKLAEEKRDQTNIFRVVQKTA